MASRVAPPARKGSDATSSPDSASSSRLTLGTRVLVRNTADVQKRFPHLAGEEGLICEVPAHPNTWYKVQCKDNQIGTMRPSALEIISTDSPFKPGAQGGSVSITLARSLVEAGRSGKVGGRTGARTATKDPTEHGKVGRISRDCRSSDNFKDGGDESEGGIPLTSVAMDTWVGRTVRITTEKHRDVTGLVVRTGNGWVNLQTTHGEVAKRAYDLVLAKSTGNEAEYQLKLEKGDVKGLRVKGFKGGGPAVSGSSGAGSGIIDDKKSCARVRNTRNSAPLGSAGGDVSDKEEDQDQDMDTGEDGDGMGLRRRHSGPAHSDFSDDRSRDGGNDDHDGDRDDKSDDGVSRTTSRGSMCSPHKLGRGQLKERTRDRWERPKVTESAKDMGKGLGRTSTKALGRDVASDRIKDKGKNRMADHDRVRERDFEKGKYKGDRFRAGNGGRDWDGNKGEGGAPSFRDDRRVRERFTDVNGMKDRDRRIPSPNVDGPMEFGEMEERLLVRDRVDRQKDRSVLPISGRKEGGGPPEGVRKQWETQIARGKERPALVEWKELLAGVIKDYDVDREDTTQSVEVMPVRCDMCMWEMEAGDRYCWNEQCWLSPVYIGYFKKNKTGASDSVAMDTVPAVQENGDDHPEDFSVRNSFSRHTILDPALTCMMQAPVKWIEAKKRKRVLREDFSHDDPALYRWQCWLSTNADPNLKDPTYIPQCKQWSDTKRHKMSSASRATGMPKSSLQGKPPGSMRLLGGSSMGVRPASFQTQQKGSSPAVLKGEGGGSSLRPQPAPSTLRVSLLGKRPKLEPVDLGTSTSGGSSSSMATVTNTGPVLSSAALPAATTLPTLPTMLKSVGATGPIPTLSSTQLSSTQALGSGDMTCSSGVHRAGPNTMGDGVLHSGRLDSRVTNEATMARDMDVEGDEGIRNEMAMDQTTAGIGVAVADDAPSQEQTPGLSLRPAGPGLTSQEDEMVTSHTSNTPEVPEMVIGESMGHAVVPRTGMLAGDGQVGLAGVGGVVSSDVAMSVQTPDALGSGVSIGMVSATGFPR
ncbi:unnamed protein product [Choristocarpus tenellus]